KKLNPSFNDLNTIYPGQVLKLPIFSPQVVRRPIKPPPSKPQEEYKFPKAFTALKNDLYQIFNLMGEEWIETGHHFIPLRTGGQVNLKAESYPIINLTNGITVVVDMHNDLPDKMAKLIKTNWESYRIVHLEEYDLRSALDKILAVCGYSEVYKLGESLNIEADIPIQISADWIIKTAASQSSGVDKIIMLTLGDNITHRTPKAIKDFLTSLQVKVIDYPVPDKADSEPTYKAEILNPGNKISALIEILLSLTGQQFSRKAQIPLYQNQKTGLKLVINADFLIDISGKDHIIDLSGLGPDIISLLKEHQFSVLSLAAENDPSLIVSMTLDFLRIEFDSGPQTIMATNRDDSRNIRLTIPGIVFHANNGQNILATQLTMPPKITVLLAQKGYKILTLSLS
ncbi:MAG: hypothetical protein SV375_20845, partial [Thermodesulfobacteriota bacterium]|nr:hypothetical protein [Thermodesulfobacteriota bacterium]